MGAAPLPPNEEERLKELHEYGIMDTPEEKIFNTIVSLASSICHVPISLVTLIDKDRQWFKAVTGLPAGDRESTRKEAFCAYTILSDTLLEVTDATKDSRFSDNPYVTDSPNIRFYGGVPLTTPNGFRLGSLCVIDSKPKKLSEEQKLQLQQLSEIVMALMESKKKMMLELRERHEIAVQLEHANAELGDKLEEQRQNYSNLSLLSQMNGMLESSLDNHEAFEVIKKFSIDLFKNSNGMIYLIEKNHEYIELMTEWGKHQHAEPIVMADDCWALRRGQNYISEEKHHLKCKHFPNAANNRSMCIPLMAQGETLGLLSIVFPQAPKHQLDSMSVTEHLLAVAMGEQIAIALANIRLRQTLREQSIYDALTGLYNRRYLGEIFRREMSRATHTNKTLALSVIDIDHFKQFNDKFGHDAGDKVLQIIAQTLQEHTHQDDTPFRLGGEEFVVLFKNVTKKEALERAEKIRKKIETLTIEHAGKDLGRLTISQGLSFFPENAKNFDALVKKSDEALYQAKAKGRNRTIVCDQN